MICIHRRNRFWKRLCRDQSNLECLHLHKSTFGNIGLPNKRKAWNMAVYPEKVICHLGMTKAFKWEKYPPFMRYYCLWIYIHHHCIHEVLMSQHYSQCVHNTYPFFGEFFIPISFLASDKIVPCTALPLYGPCYWPQWGWGTSLMHPKCMCNLCLAPGAYSKLMHM